MQAAFMAVVDGAGLGVYCCVDSYPVAVAENDTMRHLLLGIGASRMVDALG